MSSDEQEVHGFLSAGFGPVKEPDDTVYETVLSDDINRSPKTKPLIRQRTFSVDGLKHWVERGQAEPVRRSVSSVSGLLPETIEDYLTKNREPIDLEPVAFGFPDSLLPEAEWGKLVPDAASLERGYQVLRKHFPHSHGLISLSRVGLDKARRSSSSSSRRGRFAGMVPTNS